MGQKDSPASKLPQAIMQQYLRYKDSTNGLISWLFEEAKKHMEPGVLPADLKGLTTFHLLPMARACKAAGIAMPLLQFTSLERAIDLRRRVSSWYTGDIAGQTSLSEIDDRHNYFNERLQSILDMFRGSSAPQAPASAAPTPNTTVDPHVINQFSHLHLEGDDDDTDTDADVQVAAPEPAEPRAAPERIHEPVQDLVEDPCIELIWLLIEMSDIRIHVRNIWLEYKEGKIDLISAAVVTEAAFEWIAIMDEDFCIRNPTLDNWEAMIQHVFRTTVFRCPEEEIMLYLGLDREGPTVLIKNPARKSVLGDSRFKHIQKLFYPGYRMLLTLACDTGEDITADTPPIENPSEFQLFRALRDASKYLSRGVRGQSVWRLDRFGLCLSKGQKSDAIRLAASAMASIWLDFRENEICEIAADDYQEFSGKFPHGFYSIDEGDDEDYVQHKRNLEKSLLLWLDPNNPDKMKGVVYLNPVLAGIILFDAYQRVQNGIVNTTSASWSIVPMAHVYNHARVRGRWRENWADMDAVIAMQEKEVFVTKRPTDFEQCEARFWLANGGTAAELQAFRNEDASIYRELKDGGFPRGIEMRDHERMNIKTDMDRMGTIRAQKNKPGFRRQLDPTPMLTSIYVHLEVDIWHQRFIISDSGISGGIKNLIDECFREKGQSPPRDLTVPQLLDGLLAVCQCEMPHMFFDFMDLSMTCNTLLMGYEYYKYGAIDGETRFDDLDKNLFVDMYFKAEDRKLPEKWIQSTERKKDLAEDWVNWCE